jgi:hypothetical protein
LLLRRDLAAHEVARREWYRGRYLSIPPEGTAAGVAPRSPGARGQRTGLSGRPNKPGAAQRFQIWGHQNPRHRFDPRTQNVIQPFIYVREVKEVAGGLNNAVIDRIADVRDPGTGCTLPA